MLHLTIAAHLYFFSRFSIGTMFQLLLMV